jgi:hypothetical protein
MLQCMRRCSLLVVALVVVGCGHAAVETAAAPPAPSGPPAECQGAGGSSEACCEALVGQADSLLAAGKRQPAIAAYEDARHRCPRSNSVRRLLYLARHPEANTPSLVSVPVDADVDLSYAVTLGPDLRPVWQACFLDGEPLEKGRRRLTSGSHELEAEVYVTSASDPKAPVFRVAALKSFVLPQYLAEKGELAGAVTVKVSDKGGTAPPATRVAVGVEVSPFK